MTQIASFLKLEIGFEFIFKMFMNQEIKVFLKYLP